LCSGGSAIALLEDVDPSYFGPQSTVGVLDERYSSDPKINNTAQLENTNFYKRVKKRNARFIDAKIQNGESAEEMASRFEYALRNWTEWANGAIIATVGVGSDAHTSGIFPYPEDAQFFNRSFNDTSHWVTAYDAHEKNINQVRITTTLPFLRKIDFPIVFMVGKEKKHALRKMLSKDETLPESPCKIWDEIPATDLYTDLHIERNP